MMLMSRPPPFMSQDVALPHKQYSLCTKQILTMNAGNIRKHLLASNICTFFTVGRCNKRHVTLGKLIKKKEKKDEKQHTAVCLIQMTNSCNLGDFQHCYFLFAIHDKDKPWDFISFFFFQNQPNLFLLLLRAEKA